MRTPRLPRRLSRKPQRPDWHAILTLQRPRRAQLRTRVLAGVLAVTVIALVAFDFAAVGALRRYLLGHTDAQLQTVLGLYRPMTITRLPSANWISRSSRRSADFQRKLPVGLRPPAGAAMAAVGRTVAAVGRWAAARPAGDRRTAARGPGTDPGAVRGRVRRREAPT